MCTSEGLTELNPDIDLGFGLCDLGLGEAKLGYVSLAQLSSARAPLGLSLECDRFFAPTRTIAAYADVAREHSLTDFLELLPIPCVRERSSQSGRP
jgi:hypothetical protein